MLDGLSPFGVWWRIAVPIAGPGFKTVALFSFIAAWTDLMIPMTISTRPGRMDAAGRYYADADRFQDLLGGADVRRALPDPAHLSHRAIRPEVSRPRRKGIALTNN